MKRGILAAIVCLMLVGSAAQADIPIYQESFTYEDGTELSDVPGWYNWGGVVPTIVGGKAVSGGSWDFLLNMTEIFSYGNTEARIEFDAKSDGGEFNAWFAPGDASTLAFEYANAMGIQHGSYGAAYFYAFNQGGWSDPSPSLVVNPWDNAVHHWVYDLTLAAGVITWDAGYDGNPFFVVSKTLNGASALDTMEWGGLGSGQTLDNLVITAVGVGGTVVPEPAGLGLIGIALLAVRKRRS